ncbi:MAG TPA: mechanosensitive ion channel family protein [Candidatus Dormibacteraeota bacterium]|jgi:small conductance mechanosensitive channel
MLAASATVFTCQPEFFFDDLCRTVNSHDPTGIFGPMIERLIGPVVIFILVFIGGRLLRRVGDRALQRGDADAQVRALVRNIGAAVIYFFALLSGLVTAGVPLAFLLTFGGLASLAIGLAFQDVLRNVLAGIWLLVERPFKIGDVITIADMAGVVQTITLRTTALRTGDGRLAILPNLTVFSGVVINSSAYGQRRYTVSLRIERDHDLEAALRAGRRELEATAEVAKEPPPSIEPQLDGEGILLHCRYWLDYRSHDVDAIAADLARRLWGSTETSGNPKGS